VVTHGRTFCTVESFVEVAKAIAECAFTNSELPVILSLEMHCTPGQQFRLAKLMTEHLSNSLISVR
jgi:phosphatidylinositol phospholipase C, delta